MFADKAHMDAHLFRKQGEAGSIPVVGSAMRVDLLGAKQPCQGWIGGFETHYPLHGSVVRYGSGAVCKTVALLPSRFDS
jgi:hypothetical protein